MATPQQIEAVTNVLRHHKCSAGIAADLARAVVDAYEFASQNQLMLVGGDAPGLWPADWMEQFWQEYPRRVGKQEARKRLEVIKARGVPFDLILNGVKQYAISTAGSSYICHPGTWLSKGRWEDDPRAIAPGPGEEHKNGFAAIAMGRF